MIPTGFVQNRKHGRSRGQKLVVDSNNDNSDNATGYFYNK